MRKCERCGNRLDTAAKAALSSVCTPCGFAGGEMVPVALVPLTELRSRADVDALVVSLGR